MKSMIPDPEQLDELAAGLDAGWDEEPGETSPSQPPLSGPLPATLAALDADWEVTAPTPTASPTPASPTPARGAQPRPSHARPSQARPNPTRAITQPGPLLNPAGPLRVSKQERREAERKRRAHQAQQKAETKKQRKADRLAEARRASETLRAAEQQAQAERARRANSQPKKLQASAVAAPTRKRTPKRVRRVPADGPNPVADARPAKDLPTPVVVERGAKKLLLPLMIAILVAVTLGFALSRAR